MSEQKSPEDWLPDGWTTEVKVRQSGKRYKCYYDPTNELKFYSKPEVLRYLNSIHINHPQLEEKNKGSNDSDSKTREKDSPFAIELGKSKGSKRHSTFSVEKTVAEDLPAGWIKEMRVKKKGRKIRRDPYYIDPVTGYVFRSMKDVLRYLETGELGKLASKPKDKGQVDQEMEEDELSSPAEVEGMKSANDGKDRQDIQYQILKVGVAVKDEQILVSNCTGDHIPLSEQNSDQCKDSAETSSGNLPEANALEQTGGKCDSSVSVSVSTPVVEALPEKQPLDDKGEKHGTGNIQRSRNKVNKKKWYDLPRRTSKRLAGLKSNPALEPKINDQACQVPLKPSGEAESGTAENHLTYPEEHVRNVETQNKPDDKQGFRIHDADAGQFETDNKSSDDKPVLPWMDVDPCIEFAIKTLTGAIPIGDENKAEEKPETSKDVPDEGSLDLPSRDLWTDPCFEFAVKTLMGEIPVADDLNIQDVFLQQFSSSKTWEQNGLTLPNAHLNNICQADISSQHFDGAGAGMPLGRQQALAAPMLLHTGNVGLQRSRGLGPYQHVQGSGSRPRPTII